MYFSPKYHLGFIKFGFLYPKNVKIPCCTPFKSPFRSKKGRFWLFLVFFSLFSLGGGSKKILGGQNFFFQIFTQKWSQKAKTWVYRIFWEDLRPILEKAEKSFSHTFLNILGFYRQIPPNKTPQKIMFAPKRWLGTP